MKGGKGDLGEEVKAGAGNSGGEERKQRSIVGQETNGSNCMGKRNVCAEEGNGDFFPCKRLCNSLLLTVNYA